MTNFWVADTYTRFLDQRTRPARDLLYALPNSFSPFHIYDLGCGPGNSTQLLQARWPDAQITGIDSSEDMLATAKRDYPQIKFEKGDITQFSLTHAAAKADLIFTNAALQWVDQHDQLIPRLAENLAAGGYLAIQMPNNFHLPSHQTTLTVLSEHANWQALQAHLRYEKRSTPLFLPEYYYDLFAQSGLVSTYLWETHYIQEMDSHHAIYDWASGTGLRPILSRLPEAEQLEFKQRYIAHLTSAYPTQANEKVLFPFRRMFLIARTTYSLKSAIRHPETQAPTANFLLACFLTG